MLSKNCAGLIKGIFVSSLVIILISCKGRLYHMPSHSMENTIMINKTFYVSSSDNFRKNDIVVFSYFGDDYVHKDKETGQFIPEEHKRVYRLIACSGDTFMIRDGEVFINERHIPLPPTAKTDYTILTRTHIDELDDQMDQGTVSVTQNNDTLFYHTALTTDQAFEYQQRKPAIFGVKKEAYTFFAGDTSIARGSTQGPWTVEVYGPLIIPSPGDTIIADATNFKLYHNIPGIKPGKNVIKEKLYFVLGDNRHNADDSRYIGLISDSKMVGVVK
jgi:signal peptidase I